MFIKEVKAKAINDSRNAQTVEASIKTYKGVFTASAPSGKSKGKWEVACYNKKGLNESLRLVKEFKKNIEGKNFKIKNFKDFENFEKLIRKFEKKNGKLGGNVVYALETAFLKAAAFDVGKELWKFIFDSFYSGKPKMPMPVGNCIGGGLHTKKIKGKRPDFQEFELIPNEKRIVDAVRKNIDAQNYARKLIAKKMKVAKINVKRNDENAWQNNLTNVQALEILRETADKFDLRIGLDIAASSFFKEGYYEYENKRYTRDRKEQIDFVVRLIKKFKIFYVEDPMDEEDFSGFLEIKNSVPKNVLITGDDLTVTNPKRVRRAGRSGAMNAMIVKPNQVGSLVDVAKVVMYCKKKKIKMIFSHRSGDTMDDALGDYAVGFQGEFMKSGIYGRERLIKLKRVIDIEKSLQ